MPLFIILTAMKSMFLKTVIITMNQDGVRLIRLTVRKWDLVKILSSGSINFAEIYKDVTENFTKKYRAVDKETMKKYPYTVQEIFG